MKTWMYTYEKLTMVKSFLKVFSVSKIIED